MLGLVLVVLEIGALLLAIYTMVNVNAVCNDYLKRHQSEDNRQIHTPVSMHDTAE